MPWRDDVISYASMPNRRHPSDPRIDPIREAVERQMKRHGHSQPRVSELTGVSQSNISRLLSGQRKRVTSPVRALCQYAEFDPNSTAQFAEVERRLSQVLRGAIGDNAAAAAALTKILEALAPVLRTYQPNDSNPSSGADHDNARAR